MNWDRVQVEDTTDHNIQEAQFDSPLKFDDDKSIESFDVLRLRNDDNHSGKNLVSSSLKKRALRRKQNQSMNANDFRVNLEALQEGPDFKIKF